MNRYRRDPTCSITPGAEKGPQCGADGAEALKVLAAAIEEFERGESYALDSDYLDCFVLIATRSAAVSIGLFIHFRPQTTASHHDARAATRIS